MGEGATRAVSRFRSFAPLFSAAVIALLVATSLSAPAAAAPPPLRGIDVSHHNGSPDWAQVQSNGIDFVFAKATEGTTFHDPEYARNQQQTGALSLAFGAYHFARPDKTAGDAIAEADNFVGFAQLNGDNLVPVLDLEDSGGLGVRKLKRWTKDWLNEVQAQLGVKPLIYTSKSFWKAHLGSTTWFANNDYRLWVAHWTTASQPKMPAGNWGGQGWTFWQHDNCGSVAGIAGCVDQDRFNGGGLDDLRIKNNR